MKPMKWTKMPVRARPLPCWKQPEEPPPRTEPIEPQPESCNRNTGEFATDVEAPVEIAVRNPHDGNPCRFRAEAAAAGNARRSPRRS